MNPRLGRIATTVLIVLLAVTASGCSAQSDGKTTRKAATGRETSMPSAEETLSATEPSATTEPTEAPTPVPVPGPTPVPGTTTPVPVPAPKPPAPKPKPQLGPTDATTSWAYLKDMYKKNGYWYVVVDYITVEGPEESLHFVNENPRLRTFPLSDGAKLYLLKSPGSPDYKLGTVAQFATFEAGSGDEVVEVTPKAGYAIKLKQWWAP